MEIEVIRKWFKDTYTIGKMSIDKEYFCDTLEDPVRELHDINHDGDFDDEGEGKIYGETAIPCGRYRVTVNLSKKFKKRMPILLGVPGFEGVRIHAGSDPKHTEGCILVGSNSVQGRLTNGPYFSTTLTQRIDEAIKNNEKIFITIKQ